MKKESWTLLEVLRWTTGRFEERSVPTPRLDAEILIAAALGLSRVQLYVQFERPLDANELARIREHVRRRQGGESVAYIVGHKEFFGLDFTVDHRVLVPRPDTETLVDEALSRLRERYPPTPAAAPGEAESSVPGDLPPVFTPAPDRSSLADAPAPAGSSVADARSSSSPAASAPPSPKVADIGTGSGAIAITLAKQLPNAVVYAVDSSPEALEIAQSNAARHAVTITFLHGDLAAPLTTLAPFDLIAANLPYVPTADIADLAPEVRSEPRLALDGGVDGLELVRRLVTAAPALLAGGGALVLEIGAGQAEETAEFCRQAGLIDVRLRRDLGAIDRVVSAVKP